MVIVSRQLFTKKSPGITSLAMRDDPLKHVSVRVSWCYDKLALCILCVCSTY